MGTRNTRLHFRGSRCAQLHATPRQNHRESCAWLCESVRADLNRTAVPEIFNSQILPVVKNAYLTCVFSKRLSKHELGSTQDYVGENYPRRLTLCRSLENPLKKPRQSPVFCKLVLDTLQQKRYMPISCASIPRLRSPNCSDCISRICSGSSVKSGFRSHRCNG